MPMVAVTKSHTSDFELRLAPSGYYEIHSN